MIPVVVLRADENLCDKLTEQFFKSKKKAYLVHRVKEKVIEDRTSLDSLMQLTKHSECDPQANPKESRLAPRKVGCLI